VSGLVTVYASIGNSDDKLSQARWSAYHERFEDVIRDRAKTVYGDWLSLPNSGWQNACVAFGVDPAEVPFLKSELRDLAAAFDQDAVAWAEAPVTEFVGPSQTLPA
jgi:hypothetical protein